MEQIFNWLTDNKAELMNKFIYRMIPNKRDAEDFYQDLYIIMADKDEDKMNKIYNNNEMMQYVYIIIRNNLQSKNSRYYYTYRKPIGNDYNEEIDFRESYDSTDKNKLLDELQEDYKLLLSKIDRYLNTELNENPKSFYDKKVFEMYYNEDNTFRGLGERLNIPMSSIYNTVTRSKDKVTKLFKKDIELIKLKLDLYNNED